MGYTGLTWPIFSGFAGRFGGVFCSFCLNFLEEKAGGFVVGVLGNKLTRKGFFEDALAQCLGLFEAGLNGFFEFVANGQTAFNFGDYCMLSFNIGR